MSGAVPDGAAAEEAQLGPSAHDDAVAGDQCPGVDAKDDEGVMRKLPVLWSGGRSPSGSGYVRINLEGPQVPSHQYRSLNRRSERHHALQALP